MPYGNNSASPTDPAPRSLHKINYWVEQIASGSGGGGGDATAANQALQITEAEDTNAALIRLIGYQFALWGTRTETDGDFAVAAYGFKAITDVEIGTVTLGAGSADPSYWENQTIYAGDVVYLDITAIAYTGTAQFFLKPPTP